MKTFRHHGLYKKSLRNLHTRIAGRRGKVFPCDICGKQISGDAKPTAPDRAFIDHCHVTRIFRGVLCGRCNMVLGAVEDDTDLLSRTIRYLAKPPGIREVSPDLIAANDRSTAAKKAWRTRREKSAPNLLFEDMV